MIWLLDQSFRAYWPDVFRSNPNSGSTDHLHPNSEPRSWTARMVHHQSTCDGVTVTRASLSLTVNKDPICRNGRWDTQPQPRTTVWQSAAEDASLFRRNPEDSQGAVLAQGLHVGNPMCKGRTKQRLETGRDEHQDQLQFLQLETGTKFRQVRKEGKKLIEVFLHVPRYHPAHY